MRIRLFLLGVVSFFYFFTAPHVISISHDSAASLLTHIHAQEIGSFDAMFHPHELLTRRIIHISTNPFNAPLSAYELITRQLIFNAIFVSLGLLIFFEICRRRLKLSTTLSLGLVALLGVTFSTWQYRMTIENYALPVTAALAFLYILLSPGFFRKSPYLIGALHIGISLLHIRFAFLGFVVFMMVFSEKKYAWFLKYFLTCVVLMSAGYAAFWAGPIPDSFGDLLHAFSPQVGAKEYTSLFLKIPLSLIGFGRSWISPNFLFVSPVIQSAFQHFFYLHHLGDEAFMIRTLSPLTTLFLIGFLGIFLISFLGVLFISFSRFSVFRDKKLRWILVSVFCVDFLLGIYTDPITVDQFVFSIPLFILILGLGLSLSHSEFKKPLFFLFVLSLFTVNYFGFVRYANDLHNDYYYAQLVYGKWDIEPKKIGFYEHLFGNKNLR